MGAMALGRMVFALAFSVVAGALVACVQGPTDAAEDRRGVVGAESVSLRVMSFNIEWGGAHVRFASVADAIRASGADIVGIQEAEGNLQRLAADLGWHYNLRNYAISRHRIIDPAEADGKYAYVEVRPGRVVALANVHLPSDPYGPDWVRDQRAPEAVLDLERRARLPKIEPVLDAARPVHESGVPVFLTGDFNAPSHADWTEAVAGARPFVEYALDWPVSRAAVEAGFRDSFRDAHPDPLANPGVTWWAKRERIRDYNPGEGDPQDRIDFVWYAGPARVTGSQIVGEADGPGVSIAVMPWPSDHRGVVSSFDVIPAPLPPFVAAHRRVYHSGAEIRIAYYAPGLDAGSVSVEATTDGEAATSPRHVAVETERGELALTGAPLPASAYRVTLRDASGRSIGRNEFWIVDADAVPSVEILGSRFASGAPLPIRWHGGPGNRNDWLAVFDADAPRDARDMLAWGYVRARSSGALELGATTAESGWPLPPGRYVVRFLEDDGFALLAESPPFAVE
jgi:endonuclease/exonuclease/phosphatase family metal-dependent hydrolase